MPIDKNSNSKLISHSNLLRESRDVTEFFYFRGLLLKITTPDCKTFNELSVRIVRSETKHKITIKEVVNEISS